MRRYRIRKSYFKYGCSGRQLSQECEHVKIMEEREITKSDIADKDEMIGRQPQGKMRFRLKNKVNKSYVVIRGSKWIDVMRECM